MTGGRYEEREYDAVGSGSIFARESLKSEPARRHARRGDPDGARGAQGRAADEDRGTGGVDLERNIYPTIKTCTARGIETVSDDEIARAHRDVLERRRRPVEA